MKQSAIHTRSLNKQKKRITLLPWQQYAIAFILLFLMSMPTLMAQCALCTKTAQQLGDGPASGLNKGILYLMCIPLGILSIIGYKWYKKEKINQAQESSQ